jgi:agmatinase
MKTLGVKANFLAIEESVSRFASSRVVILPVPYERTVSYGGGTKHGPGAIIKASHYVELYDEETRREVCRELGIATLPPFAFGKKKDKAFLKDLEALTAKLLAAGKFVLTLGGEHTISQAPIAAYAKAYPRLSVLQIDAHSDLRQEYQGSPYSHASVMARVCEIIDPKRLVQVGIRAQCIEEAAFIRAEGITTLYAHEIRGGKYSSPTRSWEDYAIDQLSEHVYVSFDVDGLDPSIMPATGTPEPNGLTYDEAMRLLRKVGERRTVVGSDIVELAPMKGLHHPDLTSAKLASKMINYFVR